MATITGTESGETLIGGVENDLIEGLGGNDILIGRGGDDTTDGGTGDDHHLVEDAGDIVIEDAGEGHDTVVAKLSYVLGAGAHVEVMTTISASGIQAINLTGNAFVQSIYGNAGNNILNGGGGADYLSGLGGNDTYIVDDASVTVAEAAGDGDDEVITSVSYALASGAWVETLRTNNAASTAALTLSGNEVANSIYGNAGNNVLNGGLGNDFLVGLEGNDYLVGGGGTDAMLGGTGNDTYTVDLAVGDRVTHRSDPANPNLFGGSTATVVDLGDGHNITIEVDLGAGLTETRVVPISEIYAGDNILENSGEGEDVIVANAGYVLRDESNVEVLIAAEGPADITLRGNDLGNSIYGNGGDNALHGEGGDDYLVGGGGNDSLFGGFDSDALVGGAGNDMLVGDNGFFNLPGDYMAGGTGNDEYLVGGADQVVEAAGEGFDVVRITGRGTTNIVTFFLAPGVEVEAIVGETGNTQLRLHGNEFTQSIVGEDNADVLWSGGGADTLQGRGGNDTYYVQDGGETIVEAGGGGNDTVYVSTDYTLNAGAEVETISTYWQYGDQDIDITGNELSQRLIGNFGSNVLDSKGGDDTLIGLGGADTFMFSTTFGGNADTIADFESGIDTIALSHAIFDTLAPGDLDPEAFAIGSAATEVDDRIIYDPTTGNLFYDADGSGSGSAVVIATLTGMPVVQASDFAVI